ncbi:MAG: chromate efflux transporter [Bacteriovoracaceae bacterium]
MISNSNKDQWKLWSYVAAHSFGGPAGQIAVIHRLIVDEKKILNEERFLHALHFCMVLPGPEAQQLATYIGWLMNGWRGGLLAGGLFILPGFLSILTLSYLYVFFQNSLMVKGIFYGMKPAIIAIVLSALFRISKKSLKSSFHWVLSIIAFICLFFFNVSYPLIVIFAGVLGLFYGTYFQSQYDDIQIHEAFPSFKKTLKTFFIWVTLWTLPIFFILMIFGPHSTFHQMNLFFSKMSLISFGGAYAALNYVAQKAVHVFGWLQATEMVDGLAMAETTPGPLIQTVQFVGFMGAYRFSDLSLPYLSALIGSILVTWMTFVPSFLWIFTFAPYVEFIRKLKFLRTVLEAIAASVVGVILNLSIWFIFKVLFSSTSHIVYGPFSFDFPVFESIDTFALGLCLFASLLQIKFKLSLFKTLGLCILLSLLFSKYDILT